MSESLIGEVCSLESLVGRLADDFLRRQEAGERPDVEEYAARHPQAADLLRKVLASLQLLEASRTGEVLPLAGQADGPPAGTLGDFRLLREVGRGGMGIVYEAEQISLGRRVALKVLPFAATLDPRQLQRFYNEARAAAGLHHTNIVPVYAVGCERGVHYYAMQFIDGRTLADFVAQQCGGPPSQVPTVAEAEGVASATTAPPAAQATSAAPRDRAYFRRVAEWGIQAAEALDCAHTLGVVHRDIKPANLLVDNTGRLWVADFGLAQVQSDARLTLTGDLVGTLRYMSPEQALARRVVIDHRTDVYSLGATLYELLTLQPAFSGADRQELLRQIAFEEPKAPRRVNKAIPDELETIVLKAVEKNALERYGTAKELADDLQHWLEDRPILARRPTLAQRAQKWRRRHTALVRSAMLTVLLVAVASATAAWVVWQEQRKTHRALDRETRERKAADEAYRLLWEVFYYDLDPDKGLFIDLDPHREVQAGPALRAKLGDNAARRLQEFPAGSSMRLAGLQSSIGQSLLELGHYDKALPLLEQARQTIEEATGPDSSATLHCKHLLANLYCAQGKYDGAEPLYKEVIQKLGPFTSTYVGYNDFDIMRAKIDLAALYREQGKYDLAESVLREIKEVIPLLTDLWGADDYLVLRGKSNLAALYQGQGDYQRAETLYGEVLQVLKAKRGADHLFTLATKADLAGLYWRMHEFDKSIPLLEDVIRSQKAKLGAENPHTLRSTFNLVVNYRDAGRLDEAVALIDECLPLARRVLPSDSPVLRLGLIEAHETYARAGRFDKVGPFLGEMALKARREAGAESPAYAGRLALVGLNMLRLEKYSEAESALRVCLAILGSKEPDAWGTFNARSLVGGALLGQEKYAEAEPLLLQGYEGMKQRQGKIPPAEQVRLTEAIERLVQLYDAWGNEDRAEEWRKELEAMRHQPQK
jgi:serine/threonine protein kinase